MTDIRPVLWTSLTLVAAFAGPVRADDPDLIVLDWVGFDMPELMTAYSEEHGALPTFSFFVDDDEAIQKLRAGYRVDVARPCSQMVGTYRAAGLIEPWDVSRIPAFADIPETFLGAPALRDAEGVWFIPSNYGHTGLAYDAAAVPEEDARSLAIFVDEDYAGRTALPDSPDDAWALAFLATGVTDWTTLAPEQVERATGWLRRAHANARSIWSSPADLAQQLAMGEVVAAWSWAEIVPLTAAAGHDIRFRLDTEEGASVWFCGFVNLAEGPGSEDKTYDFVNAFLAPSSARALVEAYSSGHANAAAMRELPVDLLESAQLVPTSATLLAQTPMDPAYRTELIEALEHIRAGF